MQHQKLLILDYGSQYTQLIARRSREFGVFSEIHVGTLTAAEVAAMEPHGLILSGGPMSVYDDGAPTLDPDILNLTRPDGSRLPILGVCYGLQAIAHELGGHVAGADHREFGRAHLRVQDVTDPLLAGIPEGSNVWMSHSDRLEKLPTGFRITATTDSSPLAAVRSDDAPIWGVQFHPEVVHTEHGSALLRNFTHGICGFRGDWTAASFVEEKVDEIRAQVGDGRVILGLSGGVDSSVAAVLLHKALGDQLTCIFVDNGMLRKGEFEQVQHTFAEDIGIHLVAEDASALFLERLAGVADPEKKRKIIGGTFVEVFEAVTERVANERGGRAAFLAQGTLYPDVIESVSFKGPSATIKTHHNVGGLPEELGFELIEPFRELFKDEVRAIGRVLGVPDRIVDRHPFPGPGLAIRVIGAVTSERLAVLREADHIFIDELRKHDLYHETWQALAVLLPVQTVGVMGDGRTYENVCALRAVTSVDGMTADWAHLPHAFLAHVSSRIVNEVRGINRVVYDISSKPPATIEWE